jgi:deazaflavin-dependent oxidoreductase (nitroreductase family)
MLRKIGQPAPPKGFKLNLFRAPLLLYRLKLGSLFGERFIRLKHWGRVSGELKETVIEVIDQDRSARKIFSASGFGSKSQWYKNVLANENVLITFKNIEYRAAARVVEEHQAKDILLRYAKLHPKSIKGVAKLSGYEMDGSESDIVEFSSIVKVVEFVLGEQA